MLLWLKKDDMYMKEKTQILSNDSNIQFTKNKTKREKQIATKKFVSNKTYEKWWVPYI
jgi:hypothetical protein